jgi:hypothetical protein
LAGQFRLGRMQGEFMDIAISIGIFKDQSKAHALWYGKNASGPS